MTRILAVVKIMVEILWFSTEISWDSCPVHYFWSCFYHEFQYEMSIKCMIRILAVVKIMVEILWFSTEISWDSCPGSLFMKLFLLWISLWNVYKVHDQDSGHSKNYKGKFYDSVLKYHETHVRFIIYEVFLLWISLWNVY